MLSFPYHFIDYNVQMGDNFAKLPTDIHVALTEYLSIGEIITFSQTCQRLRAIYGPESWTRCCLLVSPSAPSVNIDRQLIKVRCISLEVFHYPEKYSWFLSHCVSELSIRSLPEYWEVDFEVVMSMLHDISKETFENLKSVMILKPIRTMALEEVGYSDQRLHELISESPLLSEAFRYSVVTSCKFDRFSSFLQETLYKDTLYFLRVYDADPVSHNAHANFGHVVFPSLEFVRINITHPIKARKILHAFRDLPKCHTMEISVGYYNMTSEATDCLTRYTSLIKYLNDVPISKPKISITLYDMNFQAERSGGLEGYQTASEMFTPLGKFQLDYVSTVREYNDMAHEFFDIVSLPRFTNFNSPSLEGSLVISKSSQVTSITYMLFHGASDILNFTRHLPHFPNLERISYLHNFFTEDLCIGNLNFARDILNGDLFKAISFASRNTKDLAQVAKKTLRYIPEIDYNIFKELAHYVVSTPQQETYEDSTREALPKHEWQSYAYAYFLKKLLSVNTLKTFIIQGSFVPPLHLLESFAKSHKTLELLQVVSEDLSHTMEDIKAYDQLVYQKSYNTDLPHILSRVSIDYDLAGVFLEYYPNLYRHQRLLNDNLEESS